MEARSAAIRERRPRIPLSLHAGYKKKEGLPARAALPLSSRDPAPSR
jgi:hypothetical protein